MLWSDPSNVLDPQKCDCYTLQIIDITHKGTKYQIFEACFPKQFLHPINKSHTFGKFQETPKVVRAKLHNLETPLQWTNCWSISSPLCLPQHQSTIISPPQIISCKTLFPILMQLSKQRKQLDMKPLHHICFFFFFFQGKALEEDPFRSLKKERMSKSPFFFNLHLNGSPSSFRGICNSNWWRKTPTNSTSQLLNQCWKGTSHLRTSPIFCLTKTSSTNASLFNAISNKSETQFQRLISTPPILWKPYSLPYANQICFEKSSQPILILHHKPHACEPLPSFEQHLPSPNFEATISLHNQVSSAPKHPTISPTKL